MTPPTSNKTTSTKNATFVATNSCASPSLVNKTRESVQKYYGETLQTSVDLKTNVCTSGSAPKYIRECIKKLHPETVAKYYGCGLCLPAYDLTGCRILDLGCGAGRDVYIASQLVGKDGFVVGVDMTPEQLDSARRHQEYHSDQFGYNNVQFVQGYLESLDQVEELKNESFDVIISNCVINLCTDKAAVLSTCYDLLKPGGELYFSDVYANRRVPQFLQRDEVLWGECLSGALYWNDFHTLAKSAGFDDPRLVEDAPLTISNKKIAELFTASGSGGLEFYSATYRLLKMELEPSCEDYGQAVIYKGTIPRAESSWTLDKHHVFETRRVHPVCGNTWNMLALNPRAKDHFEFIGDFSRHYGVCVGCGSISPFDRVASGERSEKACMGCC